MILLMMLLTMSAQVALANDSKNGLNVLFISSAINNAEAIAQSAKQNAIAIVYDFRNTNLHEINLTLLELIEWKKNKVSNLAIICHGAPGKLSLGLNYSIDLDKIDEEKNEWKTLATFFAANACVEFYGSQVGLGVKGQKFIDAIAFLTGATVHASDDASGNVRDADWDLEVKTGTAVQPLLLNFSQLLKTPIYF